jgi:6-phospho-beta-glucosidase
VIDRIAILGGSSVYTPEFVLSIISHNLNVKEIVLQGRSGRKLPLVAKFCQRLVDKSGLPAIIKHTTEVSEAVAGAKYVINHIRVGGMQARLRDEKLPPRFGMIGDESLGAGGFANAMRTLPVVLEYVKCIEEVNPNAVFINLANPMGIVMEAVIKLSKLNGIGVCELPGTYVKKVAEILRVPVSEMEVDYIGLYHMGWIQDVKIDGRSQMIRVLERLENHQEDGFDCELIDLFRMIPTRTVSLYFHQDAILKKQQSCDRFRAEVLHEAEQQILKLYEDESLTELPELTRARNAIWYEETILPLVKYMESASEHSAILCVRNDGAIRDLPGESSVEIPVRVSKKGLKPRKVGSCPRFLKGLFLSQKESDRLTVEAVRHQSYECALQALTINPLVPSYEAAKRYLDHIIKNEGFELH